MNIECLPGSLQQQGIARAQRDLPVAHLAALALNRDDEQVAAFGHHAGEGDFPDQCGTRRYHDFCQAGLAVEEDFLGRIGAILAAKRQVVRRGKCRCRFRVAADQDVVASLQCRSAQRAVTAALMKS